MNNFPALISNSDLTLFDAGRESSGFEYTSSCLAKTPVLQFFLTFQDSLKEECLEVASEHKIVTQNN